MARRVICLSPTNVSAYLRFVRSSSGSVVAPRMVVYSGPGVSVPSTFFGTTFQSPIVLFGTAQTTDITATDATENRLTIAANNGRLHRAEQAEFLTTGTLPAPLQLGQLYDVVNKGPVGPTASYTTFQVALNGALVDITNAGSGTHSVRLSLSDLGSQISTIRSVDSMIPYWSRVNTSDGVFDWTNFDAAMQYHAVARGRKVLYTLYQTPTWAARNSAIDLYGYAGGGQAPTDFSKLATFAAEVVKRYNKVSAFNPSGVRMIHAIELWNEPGFDAIGTVGSYWAGTYAEMAQIARLVNAAIKAEDAQILLISPGFTNEGAYSGEGVPRTRNFLNASDGAGGFGRDWVDGVSYHGYSPMGDDSQDVHALPAQLARLRRELVLGGLSSSFPLYQTERGVIDAADALAQARAAIVESALGVKMSIGYTYDGFGANPRENAACKRAIEAANQAVNGKIITYCAINQDGSVSVTANGQSYEI